VKPTSTWILVADNSGARIFETLGSGQGLHEHHTSGTAPDGDTGAAGVGLGHRLIGPRPRASKALQALFAKQLGAMLSGYLRNEAFDRLVLVAPSAMLDELRKMLSPAVRKKIVVEIERDMTNIPTSELSVHLGDVVSL
jgi:protein required for attachment to host cells